MAFLTRYEMYKLITGLWSKIQAKKVRKGLVERKGELSKIGKKNQKKRGRGKKRRSLCSGATCGCPGNG